ncbi:pancreatic triacylglycerol lipase-like [Rhynchophorus ferrugineus]|uniref:pancreatic triacylglycerol lipase-like n=1 Tax=Rhynchophorus ferrugineus TaxID=354439 RepID=UPI003FCE453A
MNTYTVICILFSFAFCKSDLEQRDISPDVVELNALRTITDQINGLNTKSAIQQRILFYDNSAIYFYVYTQSSTSGTKLTYDESSLLSSVDGFSTDLRTVFIIHGWTDNYESDVNTLIRAALLTYDDVNIISVDWSSYSRLLYSLSVSSVPNVGETIGLFIESLLSYYSYSPDDIILIGHSLGAHVAGFAGKKLNGTLGVIVGLDPAGPLYFESSTSRLNVGDAQYVQAIHTDSSLFGVNYALGNIDFWPNGGNTQPGCLLLANTCSHWRSFIFMAESIGDNQFYARECDSYDDYIGGGCASNTLALMGGLNFNTSLTGNFYLKTSSSSPYGLGNIYGD